MSLPKPYYQDSAVTIYHGDCREIVPLLGRFDLLLTDPPYGVEFEYAGEFQDTFSEWKQLVDFLIPWGKANASATLLCTSKIEGEAHIWRNHMPDWRICWYKGALSTRSHIGFKDWEPIFVWGRANKTPMHDYFYANPESFGTHGHPCPKPEEWATWLVSRASNEGATVLDPFCGSGTTGRACKDLGRKCTLIEREEKYCEIAARRMGQEVLNLT